MIIVNLDILDDFMEKHPQARNPIKRWIKIAQESNWNNFADIKESFNAADYTSGVYIFDIKGNSYRLLAEVFFAKKTVYVIDIMTHAEYSRIRFFRR